MGFELQKYMNERVYPYVNNMETADLQENTMCSVSKTLKAKDIYKETIRQHVHKSI